jgi:guanosine-3',5'-bis(diphosphate) 3'-pyrophosphohydrolase
MAGNDSRTPAILFTLMPYPPPLREIPDTVNPTLEELTVTLRGAYGPQALEVVQRAYDFARDAHGDEKRLSGEPYITHPVATAYYLASIHMDAAAIAAGLLHDVVEDTAATTDDVRGEFGATVARIVEGVTKFAEIRKHAVVTAGSDDDRRRRDYSAEHAENLRKMFLAMAEDPRVVIVKLADRLHNMRTLEYVNPEKRRRIALDTREIYGPLAGRVGIAQLKWPLEDLAFKYLEPERFQWLVGQLQEQLSSRQAFIAEMTEALAAALHEQGSAGDIYGRPKHLYSIYRKLLRPEINMNIDLVYDLFALRVILDTVSECYQAVGTVHSMWPPLSHRFKDYIAVPKPNGYQSLHTTVTTATGRSVEVQIRTTRMHEIAELGLAAHWWYKERGESVAVPESLTNWVKSLTNWQQEIGEDAADFVDTLKSEALAGEVFVFTPKGAVIDLPVGATPVDFAYRIHTDIGNRCVGAKVNGIIVPLSSSLKTGDRVEILTSKMARGPGRDWITFVKTASARQKIRQWYKRQNREDNIARGRELLDHELQRMDRRRLSEVSVDLLAQAATDLRYRSYEDLLAAIGYGAQSAHGVIAKLGLDHPFEAPKLLPEKPFPEASSGVRVMGTGNLYTRMARCCSPAYGDPIVGFTTRSAGVTIHRQDCPRIRAETERERIAPAEWGQPVNTEQFAVPVIIEAWDRDGLLRDVTNAMSNERVGLSQVGARVNRDGTATVRIILRVGGIEELAHIFGVLERIPAVRSARRAGARSTADPTTTPEAASDLALD